MDQLGTDGLAVLETIVGAAGLIHGPDAPDRYTRDWSGELRGMARAIVRPGSTAEMAGVVARCAERRWPIAVQGGHTGLVGSATPSRDGNEIVLSLERMRTIRALDPANFSMTVEAGCILQHVQEAARAADRYFPLSLGAEGSCQIGGNVATNAGGLNVLRYGMARDLVLGLEVVLADGTVWDGLKALRKDNSGYDLKQLFIGAEGTLGIITAATLKLFPRPIVTETAFLALPDVERVMQLFAAARAELGDLCSAFELLPRDGLELALSVIPGGRDPLETPAPYYVLMECGTSARLDLRGLLEALLGDMLKCQVVSDGAIAASRAQAAEFWRLREGLVEAQARRGRHLRTDVSVPISSLPAFLDQAHAAIRAVAPDSLPLAYGHVGDGNVHLNVLPPPGLEAAAEGALLKACEAVIFEIVDHTGGSISAEHGIGLTKRAALDARLGAVELTMREKLKRALDPMGLLNPGRILELP